MVIWRQSQTNLTFAYFGLPKDGLSGNLTRHSQFNGNAVLNHLDPSPHFTWLVWLNWTQQVWFWVLVEVNTKRPPLTSIVPYANSWFEVIWRLTQIQSVWHSDWQLRLTTFSPTLCDIKALWKLKQTKNIADDNLFGGLRVNPVPHISVY